MQRSDALLIDLKNQNLTNNYSGRNYLIDNFSQLKPSRKSVKPTTIIIMAASKNESISKSHVIKGTKRILVNDKMFGINFTLK